MEKQKQEENSDSDSKAYLSSTFWRLVEYASPDKWHIFGACTALILSSASNIALPAIIGKVLDESTQIVILLILQRF
jgi:ABC-type multidrug transport system fused ATPase/permease subunit